MRNPIEKFLSPLINSGRTGGTFLILAEDREKALKETLDFSSSLLGAKNLEAGHPDFFLVTKQKTGARTIGIEEIRDLKDFLYKTPVLSKNKVGIIFEADSMNRFSTPACLKILEEAPGNSYIFLIASSLSGIPSTIQSRCVKIMAGKTSVKGENYFSFLDDLKKAGIGEINLLDKFCDSKDPEIWKNFSYNFLTLFSSMVKKSIDKNFKLEEKEEYIYENFKKESTGNLIYLYEKASRLVGDTLNYDLDLKASTLVLASLGRII